MDEMMEHLKEPPKDTLLVPQKEMWKVYGLVLSKEWLMAG